MADSPAISVIMGAVDRERYLAQSTDGSRQQDLTGGFTTLI